jgi:hypothetical protein
MEFTRLAGAGDDLLGIILVACINNRTGGLLYVRNRGRPSLSADETRTPLFDGGSA